MKKNGSTVNVHLPTLNKVLNKYPTKSAYCKDAGVSQPVLNRILLTGRCSERIAKKLIK